MSEELKNIVLKDEEGNEIEFEVITKLDVDDEQYVIVIPVNEDVEEAIALRIDKDQSGQDVLVVVEDDDEFETVSEAYSLAMSE